MNINKSFSFPFEDQQWVNKLGLGALITLVPILNFAWQGYMVDILRNVMRNADKPLPDWGDLGKKWTDGLILFAAWFIYSLPILIVICLPSAIMFIPAMLSGNRDLEGIAQSIAGVGSLLFICLMCGFLLYMLALSVIFPAIMVFFAREGTFASCFKFRDAFNLISRNSGPYFTAWGVAIGAGLLIGFALGIVGGLVNIIPCIGQVVSIVLSIGVGLYTTLVYTHLFGQFGSLALGEPQAIVSE